MKKKYFLQEMEGAIFDLDGTLLDSSWVWNKVDEKFLGDRGYDVPEDYVEAISPLGAYNAALYTIDRFNLKEDPHCIVREWFDMAKKEYAENVMCKPYTKKYLEKLSGNGIKMSVATSSDPELFMSTLEREDILKYFSHIVTVDQVPRGKGFPDIYQEAAARIGIAIERCVVFEDILTGVSGAKMGGFKVVGVQDENSAYNRHKIIQRADYYIESFEALL